MTVSELEDWVHEKCPLVFSERMKLLDLIADWRLMREHVEWAASLGSSRATTLCEQLKLKP